VEETRRYYTVSEANRELPRVRERLNRIIQLRSQLKLCYSVLDEAGYAPCLDELSDAGDDEPPIPENLERDRAVFQALSEALWEEVERLHESGCIIKDVESGMVDWYARHRGRDVFLCWHLGEDHVAHWHEIEAGYAGRRPADELAALSAPVEAGLETTAKGP